MNSYERVMKRLEGKAVDRAPNLCILMGFAAEYAGVPYRKFCLEPEKMVEANLLCHEAFGVDIVTVMSDPYGEAMDYGMAVEFPENENPRPVAPFWGEEMPSAESLPLRQVKDTQRMKDRIRTIEGYARRVKGTCPIAGWVEGAVAEYCDLRDINRAMMDFAEESPYLDEVLDRITQQAIMYSQAQLAAGADIIGIGDAACSLLGPRLYERYGFPYEKQLVDAIHDAGGKVKLHICGNIQPLLPKIADLEADIVDVDSMVDLAYPARVLEGRSAVSGNMDPVAVMLQGSVEQVRRDVGRCLEEGGAKAIVSGGCETPRLTPRQNLLAVQEALICTGR